MNDLGGRWAFLRRKVRIYRAASDAEVLHCLSDKPQCGFAVIHQAIDRPFALREARRRGLDCGGLNER